MGAVPLNRVRRTVSRPMMGVGKLADRCSKAEAVKVPVTGVQLC